MAAEHSADKCSYTGLSDKEIEEKVASLVKPASA